MITQCSIRHLYAANAEPGVSFLIDKAKNYERRRCGHLPEDYPEPLNTKDCLAAVVDPKGSKTNKHRYVIASQDREVRKDMRDILGVPLIYINRSVMLMEPMADATAGNREKEERGKLRDGLRRGSGSLKRKREDDDEAGDTKSAEAETTPKKSKKRKGPKEPNPLSMKKAKKPKVDGAPAKSKSEESRRDNGTKESVPAVEGSETTGKKKRKRKHKSTVEGGRNEFDAVAAAADGPD